MALQQLKFIHRHRRPIVLTVAVVLGPLMLLNATVSWLGDGNIPLLSPRHLRGKVSAVGQYALHRPMCLIRGHPDMADVISRAAARHKLPPGLLESVVQVESGSLPHRISTAAAMGPGQLTPGTSRMLKVDDPYDTEESVDGSARYLKQQLNRFGNVRFALAAYNAGPGAVRGRVPRNGETEFYVEKVMREYNRRRPDVRSAKAKVKAKVKAKAKPAQGKSARANKEKARAPRQQL